MSYSNDFRSRTQTKRRIRGLIVTYNCNLNCVYCYVKNKKHISATELFPATFTDGLPETERRLPGKIMPVETAKAAIIDVFTDPNTGDYDEVQIDFAGAEPLTVFHNIRRIAEWFWNQEWPKSNILFATTNGTLLNQEMKEWFIQHKERFVLGLSYDGNTETQNINRSGSGASVDLDFFLNTWPKQPVKMTISEQTVGSLADNIIYLHEKGFLVTANPANGMNAWDKSNLAEYGKQLGRLMDYYLHNPSIIPATLFSVGLPGVLESFGKMGHKYCGAGEAYDVVDVDGKKYPCHMFSPLVISDVRLEALENIDFCSEAAFQDPRCAACVLKRICPSCYGLNFKQHGTPAIRDEALCKLFVLQVLANCKYRIRLLGPKESLTREERQYIQAIKIIYDYFYPDKNTIACSNPIS